MSDRILDALREMQGRQRTTQYYLSTRDICRESGLNMVPAMAHLHELLKAGRVERHVTGYGAGWRLNPDYVESE